VCPLYLLAYSNVYTCLPVRSIVGMMETTMTKPKDLLSLVDRARLGGLARKTALTPEQRSEIARQGAVARAARISRKKRREIARKAVRARWEKSKAKEVPSSASGD
jgi:hypothetical protein